jgi:hypothetical protein
VIIERFDCSLPAVRLLLTMPNIDDGGPDEEALVGQDGKVVDGLVQFVRKDTVDGGR